MTRFSGLKGCAQLVFVVGFLAGGATPAWADTAVVDREVNGLMAALVTSGCEFNRNGSWYDGKRAASHLRRKYDYLRDRESLPDTETFIELAASRSSVSGKDYLVRCGDQPPMTSRAWFRARLGLLRGAIGQPPVAARPSA